MKEEQTMSRRVKLVIRCALAAAFCLGVVFGPGRVMAGTFQGATVYFVDCGQAASGDGTSWATAMKTIQEAISACNTAGGGEVWVKAGTYSPDDPVSLLNWVNLYGGFAGNETARCSRDPWSNVTVIDGANTTDGIAVMRGESPDTVIFDGFTVTGATGSGIVNEYGWLTVSNCVITGNSGINGGGIYSIGTFLSVTQTVFFGNTAENQGGAVYDSSTTSSFTDCLFFGNNAAVEGFDPDCEGTCDISYSDCVDSCAETYDCDTQLTTCQGTCDGMEEPDYSICMSDCEAVSSDCWMQYEGCQLLCEENYTLCYESCESSVYPLGGALYLESAAAAVTNCTIAGNHADSEGGGIYNSCTLSISITNCIVWGNTANTWTQVADGYGNATVSYSDVEGGYTGTGNLDSDPLFAGGYGDWRDYRLSQTAAGEASDSPCVDAGSSTASLLGLGIRSTRTDSVPDIGTVDMGFHYQASIVVYVDASKSDGNAGLSWATAKQTVQAGIDTCAAALDLNPGASGQVWVKAGTYSAGSEVSDGFLFAPEVELYGGFAGTETSIDQRDYEANKAILSGDEYGNYVLVRNWSLPAEPFSVDNAVVDGFEISGAAGDEFYPGGGVSLIGASLTAPVTIRNCTISGNTGYDGAGIYCSASGMIVENCTIATNSDLPSGQATSSGGGILCTDGTDASISNCVIKGNSSYTKGGGIAVEGGSAVDLLDCALTGNTAELKGGGIAIVSSSPTLRNCVILENEVSTTEDYTDIHGGGIYVEGASSAPQVINCLIAYNGSFASTSVGYGGAGYGGGLHVTSGDLSLINCTLSKNKAGGYGGALGGGVSLDSGVTGKITNSIVWGNSSSSEGGSTADEGYDDGSSVSVSYSDVGDGLSGTNSISTDPLFVSGFYLSNTETGQAQDSPCIEAGNNTAASDAELAYTLLTTRVDGTADSVPVDMGYHYASHAVFYVDGTAGSDANDGKSWGTAKQSVQSGIDLCYLNGGGEVWVKYGTYKPTTGEDRYVWFVLKPSVEVYGGFAGTESGRAERNWVANETILSGDINDAGVDTDNSFHVVEGADDAVLDGFTVTGAYGDMDFAGGGCGLRGGLPDHKELHHYPEFRLQRCRCLL